VGKQPFFKVRKSQIRKSANSWAHSAIANPQISVVCQSANCKSANFHDKSAFFYKIVRNSVSKSITKIHRLNDFWELEHNMLYL
jgi:hypothetical protein